MELSADYSSGKPTAKKRVFGLAPPCVRIQWPSGGYERLEGSKKPRKIRRGPAIRLGRKRRAIIVGLCRKFRFRILFRAYRRGILRRLKSLYVRVLEELKEAGPGMETVNTSALINAHFSIASLPSSVPSMAYMGF